MSRIRTSIVLALAALSALALCASAQAYGNSASRAASRAVADAQKRKAEKEKEHAKDKAADGLKEWKLSGSLKGTGAAVQFVPDKPTAKDQKQIANISLSGKAREDLEGLLKGKKLSELVGHRLELVFYGQPEQHGAELQFNVLEGAIKEWRKARVLQ